MSLIVSMCKTSAPKKKRVINNSFRWLMRTFWQIIRNWPSWFLLIYFYLPFGCNWLTHAMKVFLIRLTEIKSQGHRDRYTCMVQVFRWVDRSWTTVPISFLRVVPVFHHYVLCFAWGKWMTNTRIIELCIYI